MATDEELPDAEFGPAGGFGGPGMPGPNDEFDPLNVPQHDGSLQQMLAWGM
jgi:hypothetical protein